MAAAWKLRTHVHVVERDSDGGLTGRSGTFGPGDEVPDWAVVAITNPDVWESQGSRSTLPPAPDSTPDPSAPRPVAGPAGVAEEPADELVRLQARINEVKAALSTMNIAGSPPPKGGPGSGAPAWREYAASKDVEVADDASREDVIAALTEAGVPTE